MLSRIYSAIIDRHRGNKSRTYALREHDWKAVFSYLDDDMRALGVRPLAVKPSFSPIPLRGPF